MRNTGHVQFGQLDMEVSHQVAVAVGDKSVGGFRRNDIAVFCPMVKDEVVGRLCGQRHGSPVIINAGSCHSAAIGRGTTCINADL